MAEARRRELRFAMFVGRYSVVVPVTAAILVGALAASREPLVAFVGAITILGLLLSIARPLNGLAIATCLGLLAPFLVVPQRLGVQPPILDLLVLGAFVGLVARLNRDDFGMLSRWWIALVVVAAGWPILASLATYAGRTEWQSWQFAAKLSLYTATPLMVVMARPSRRSVQSFMVLVSLGTVLQAIFTISLYWMGGAGITVLGSLGAVGYPVSDIARFLPDQVTPRATGLMVDPNVLGVSLAAGLPFLIYRLRERRSLAVFILLGAFLVMVALALTISRSSWIAAAVGMLVWIAVDRPRVAILATAFLAGCIAVLPIEIFARLREGFSAKDPSSALRVEEIREAFRVVRRFPWFGVGYGASPHPDIFIGVSNAWLWLAERTGLGAAVLHLALIGTIARFALGRVKQEPLLRPLLASLTAFSVAGIFDHHIVSFPHLVFLLGGVVGLIFVVSRSPLGDAR